MNKGLYRKLALQNIKNNKNTFLPFTFSCTAMIAMFYMLFGIYLQATEELFYGARTMRMILGFGTIVCGIFSLFVVFYTNSFLMKRRSREFGLYSILGLEKKHIAKVVFWEIALIGAGSIAAGLVLGILFSKFMFMLLLNILRLSTDFRFQIMPKAVAGTAMIYAIVFVLMILANSIRVIRLKPVDLLSGSRAGEKEPKAKWIMALEGCICLGAGYYLALVTKNPMEAMGTFFVAVLFVIAGTYMLFMAGSITLLKLLKKNKKFYYQKRHFITVSGLIYRMKQNAVGLANICILSTAVIVILSTTVSLYAGMEDVLKTRYPKEVMTTYLYEKDMEPEAAKEHYDYSAVESALAERAKQYNLKMDHLEKYYSYFGVGSWNDNIYTAEYQGASSMVLLEVITLEDYNKEMGTEEELKENEVMLYQQNCKKTEEDNIKIAGREFQIKKQIKEIPYGDSESYSYGVIYIIVKDLDVMLEVRDVVNNANTDTGIQNISYNLNFDLIGETKEKEAFCTGLRDFIGDTGIAHVCVVENRLTVRQEFFGIYGSLFFIGLFIGAMFLITTVMIIYYKQISEGYDDRERFGIMQKVGMSGDETKSVIKNQILLVFFLPIVMAAIHICFAFDIIKKLLAMLNLSNVRLFAGCTVATIGVFVIVYSIVYTLTARTYYRITNKA